MERGNIALWIILVAAVYVVVGAHLNPTGRYYIDDITGYKFPYYANLDLSTENSSVTKLILVIHGGQRNAIDYYNLLYNIAQSTNTLPKTAIVAPHFLCWKDNPTLDVLSFDCDGWLRGLASVNKDTIYSFTVLDWLLIAGAMRFPHLTEIIVVGHSAGGQTVQRYGASTTKGITEVLRVPVKYVVVNPGTYMYLDDKRLSHSAHHQLKYRCPALSGSSLCNFTASDFVGPYWRVGSCPEYNSGKYGLENSEGYIRNVPANTIIQRYPSRNFTYLLGDLDVKLTRPLDLHCAANDTGYSRKQRGLVWEKYLYLTQNVSNTTQVFKIVPHCGHEMTCMFNSSEFRAEIGSPTDPIGLVHSRRL
ncbi:hypothetical protein BC938DRAFT_476805 [Jimgerdemannia flammicorona]|uniref:Alpha/Beta hydrolase protein n=1 Tax=Jimgerdemannia flammicorona TaxID=994334 RepID=A0A433QQ50_9FUNG|nr:hypothetical protein BC938DRAFT_476805 [Jimgerdemannia flammicorona]